MSLRRFIEDFQLLGPEAFLVKYAGVFLLELTDAPADADEQETRPAVGADDLGAGEPTAIFLSATPASAGGLVLGRSRKADVRVDLPRLSKRHLKFTCEFPGPQWQAEDLGSKNGSWVDGARLQPKQPVDVLDDSDVAIGPYLFRLITARSLAMLIAESVDDDEALAILGDRETQTSPLISKTEVVPISSTVRPSAEGSDSAGRTDSWSQVAAPSGHEVPGFEIIRPLGRGGMADVVLARRVGPGGFTKNVAVKRLLPEFADDGDFLEMFIQEARNAARINHPNVVQIYDLGEMEDRYYMAMEYVPGWDLSKVLRAAHRLNEDVPVEVALRISADICAGIHAAHSCVDDDGVQLQLIHRDISPHNVMMSVAGVAKITDFGISKAADSVRKTQPGELKGKLAYMAPEQIDTDLGEMDARTDMFAVGLTIWETLAGFRPLKRPSEMETLRAALNAEVPLLSEAREGVPQVVVDAIARAVQRLPADRFESVELLQRELERGLLQLEEPGSASRVAEWLRGLSVEERGEEGLPVAGKTKSGRTTAWRGTPVTMTARISREGDPLPPRSATAVGTDET